MINYKYIIILSVFLIAGCSITDDHGDSETGISPETLSEHLSDYKIVDLRAISEYEQGHIEGAYNIPIEDLSTSSLESYSLAKEDSIVLYANSDLSPNRAMKLLEAMEYHDVKILNGGMTHWIEDGFEVVEGESDYEVNLTPKTSSLVILDNEHDFGIIRKENGVVETDFTIRNNGMDVVEITQTSTSCGCTTVEISKERIEAGDEAVLTMIFDPNFHEEPEGRFTRTAFIETSEGVELQAKINVEIE